ncbi:unnamed protein product [Oreochromis niloticus]|nr:unnamed protein product [Mustela putorius furo]
MPGSSAFTKELAFVFYLPDKASKKKVVLLLSSMHTQPSKPEALALALIKPLAEQRFPSSNLSRQLRVLTCSVLKIPTAGILAGEAGPVAAESSSPSVRHGDCPAGLDRKA